MQRRILLIAIVFVAGFGLGYGITWLTVGTPDRPESVATAETAPQRPAPHVVEPVAGESEAAPREPQEDEVADVGELAAADVAPEAGQPDAVEAPEAAVAPSPRADIDRCLNQVCRIDFGGVTGGISVRKGKLEHGAEVNWERDFGRAEKVGTLDSGRNVKVEVLGIGLTEGEPAAAYIVRTVRRGKQHGVIALKIGERRLSLEPIEE